MSTKIATAFLDRLQRSGLLTGDRLSRVKQELEAEGVDLDDATAIAQALVGRGELTEWQSEKLLQGKHKGFFLSSYRLLRPLGRGGMGAVFLAQHEMMRRQCAIKVLPYTQIKEGSSVLDRFYVEAQAVAALDHQNIVRAYDVNKEVKDSKEIHYLVMEYVDGLDVQAMVQKQGPLDCVKAAEYLRQTANGLAHAHENGLIHRDVKPANLLIDNKGVVKILDLGLARFFEEGDTASLTAAHNETVLGTADYLSPEQALNSHTVDHRTDIYSLGCTAYFMLTGHPPFPEGTVAQRLVAHQVKTPTPLSEERPDTPPELAAIVERMMAKKPEDRFGNAEEVAKTLAAWLIEYGGEDWRRQHSEISGDRTLLKMLTQPHEPTRAISSFASETELELAPLDDADDLDLAAGVSGSSDSQVRETSESAEPVLGLQDLEDADDAPAQIDADALPPLDTGGAEDSEESRGSLPGEIESLGELPAGTDLGALDEKELLAETSPAPLEGLEDLDGLAHEDPLAKPSGMGSGSLGALDSHIRRKAGRGSSSSIRRRGDSGRRTEPKPQGGGMSVGLPIIIGVGGGLLLVLVIIGILAMTSSHESDVPRNSRPVAMAPGQQGGGPAGETEGERGDAAAAGKPTEELADDPPAKADGHRGKATREKKGTAPKDTAASPDRDTSQSGTAPAAKPQGPPRPAEGRGPQGDSDSSGSTTQKPPAGKAEVRPADGAGEVPPEAVAQTPDRVVRRPESEPSAAASPPVESPQPYKDRPQPPKPARDPAELLAGIERLGSELLVNGEPPPANAKMDFLGFIKLNLRNLVEYRLDLEYDDSCEDTVMVLNVTGGPQDDYVRLNLSAELQRRGVGDQPLVLWSGDVDLQPYRGRPPFDLWKKNVGSLYGDFENAHRKAERKYRD